MFEICDGVHFGLHILRNNKMGLFLKDVLYIMFIKIE